VVAEPVRCRDEALELTPEERPEDPVAQPKRNRITL
jgi:hypothetical protein